MSRHEACQLPEYRFQQLVPMVDRYVLVGDPGQIDPLIQSDVSPWGCDPAGPHVPCPRALLVRHPGVCVERLPVSWRLPKDTAALVRDAFYNFGFVSGDAQGVRELSLDSGTRNGIDHALDVLASPGTSIAGAMLPSSHHGLDMDPEIAAFAADAVRRLLEREARWVDERGGDAVPLFPADIGIVTAHRAQVAEIDRRLGEAGIRTGEGGVVVETTERWQGLQRQVMLVHHPLAGMDHISEFDLDRGRLCVMLSRHRIACLLIGRTSIREALDNHVHTGQRFPGAEDREYAGWRAHDVIWTSLESQGRLVEVTA